MEIRAGEWTIKVRHDELELLHVVVGAWSRDKAAKEGLDPDLIDEVFTSLDAAMRGRTR